MPRIATRIIRMAILGLFALSGPAVAQKSKDTLRYPLVQGESALDRYVSPGSFANEWEPTVFDNLIGFDPKKGAFVPLLVRSWTQPNNLTFEFELRDDVKFHDGQKFDADDVVYTFGYLIDPKVKLRYKRSWDWIKSVEKLSPSKFRIVAKAPDPDGLMWLAYGTPMYPKHLHGPLADKFEFGTKPVGTGPYKLVKLDKNTGLIAEKHNGFVPGPMKPGAQIGKIVSEPIPDAGTMVATLLTDRADVIVDVPIDQALDLSKTGRFHIMLSPPRLGYIYLSFPNAAWERVKALGDVRVRMAIMKAIDRKALAKAVYGPLSDQIVLTEGLCSKEQLGCGYTKMPPAYDPAGARKLLAEAGHADGLNLTISAYRDNMAHATAISGMLRDVGIRLEVRAVHNSQRLKLIKEGKVEIGYWGWSGGNMFTVSPQIVRHLQSGESDDKQFAKLTDAPFHITDDKERRKAVAKAFDYLNENAYSFPMISNRDIFTATNEVAIRDPNDLRAMLIAPHEFVWK